MSQIAKDLERHLREEVRALAARHCENMQGMVDASDAVMAMFLAGLDMVCNAIATAAANTKDGRDAAVIDLLIARVPMHLSTHRDGMLSKARACAGGGAGA